MSKECLLLWFCICIKISPWKQVLYALRFNANEWCRFFWPLIFSIIIIFCEVRFLRGLVLCYIAIYICIPLLHSPIILFLPSFFYSRSPRAPPSLSFLTTQLIFGCAFCNISKECSDWEGRWGAQHHASVSYCTNYPKTTLREMRKIFKEVKKRKTE
jgi:hypothetical protein